MEPTTSRTALQGSLVVAWGVLGILAGVAFSDVFSRWVMLLVPVVLVAAWLLWNTGVGREAAAVLIGFSSCPFILATRAGHPDCQAFGCEPRPGWPWMVAAFVLVAGGLALMLAPGPRRGKSAPASQ